MSQLQQLLKEQKTLIATREQAIQEYNEANIPNRPWRGFWRFPCSRRNGAYLDMFIEQYREDGGSITAVWREGQEDVFELVGKLSDSQQLVLGATVHLLPRKNIFPSPSTSNESENKVEQGGNEDGNLKRKFMFPACLKLGHGHLSITANFDWAFMYPSGTDPCIMTRGDPLLFVVYTTANDKSKSTTPVPQKEDTNSFQEEDGEAVRSLTGNVLRAHDIYRLQTVRNICASIAGAHTDHIIHAPTTSTSDLNLQAKQTVLKKQFANRLANGDFLIAWEEGGLHGTDDAIGVLYGDVEEAIHHESKACLIPTNLAGVASVRHRKVNAVIVHIDMVPANVGSAADPTTASAKDKYRDQLLGVNAFLPPTVVDAYTTISGSFTSEAAASAALAEYILSKKVRF